MAADRLPLRVHGSAGAADPARVARRLGGTREPVARGAIVVLLLLFETRHQPSRHARRPAGGLDRLAQMAARLAPELRVQRLACRVIREHQPSEIIPTQSARRIQDARPKRTDQLSQTFAIRADDIASYLVGIDKACTPG